MFPKQSLINTPVSSIKSLLKTLSIDIEEIGDLEEEIIITGITNDSRKVSKGDLFVAYNGIHDDGHKYIQQAVERGAKALITEKSLTDIKIPYLKVKDGRKALAKASAALYKHPSKKMLITGITGTNGKTTTTFLLDHILNCDNKKAGLLGTIYNKFNNEYTVDSSLTTLTAPELHKTLNKMHENNIDYVNMEVSSHSLKEKRVDEVDFNIAGITNFSFDHRDYHPDYRDYFLSKSKLFKILPTNSFAIFNVDDPLVLEFCNRTRAQIITYSLNYDHSMIKIDNLKLGDKQSEFILKINEEISTVNNKVISPSEVFMTLPVPGEHNVYNAVLATICAIILEVDLEKIPGYLRVFNGLFRRFQVVYKNDFTIIDDFAHNPESINAVMDTVRKLSFNSLIPIFAIRGGRGDKINKKNAISISKQLDNTPFKELIVTKYKDVDDKTNTVTKSESDAFFDSLSITSHKFSVYESLKPALIRALKLAKENDIILLIGGKGMNQAQVFLKDLIKYHLHLPQ